MSLHFPLISQALLAFYPKPEMRCLVPLAPRGAINTASWLVPRTFDFSENISCTVDWHFEKTSSPQMHAHLFNLVSVKTCTLESQACFNEKLKKPALLHCNYRKPFNTKTAKLILERKFNFITTRIWKPEFEMLTKKTKNLQCILKVKGDLFIPSCS